MYYSLDEENISREYTILQQKMIDNYLQIARDC